MSTDRIAGEEILIREYLAPLTRDTPGALGLTDDCAVLVPEPGRDLVLKTDPVVSGVHFFADDDPADIAWKALAVNVSDLAAKGARPEGYLMTLSFPEAPRALWMQGFVAGLGQAQKAFGCHLLGGDTDRVPHGALTIGITVLGSVVHGRMVRRGGARPGDKVFVSGLVGDSGLGLKIREAERAGAEIFEMLEAAEKRRLRDRYLRPSPRLGLAPALADHASAAMDLSDGLVKDARRMARASGVDITLRAGQIPVSSEARKLLGAGAAGVDTLLTSGDDYEILATVSPEAESAFRAVAEQSGIAATEVGSCKAGAGLLEVIGDDGAALQFARDGWDHLA